MMYVVWHEEWMELGKLSLEKFTSLKGEATNFLQTCQGHHFHSWPCLLKFLN